MTQRIDKHGGLVEGMDQIKGGQGLILYSNSMDGGAEE
jgi:hypothetical protein